MANDVERMYYGGNQAPSSGVTRDDLHKFIMKIVQAQGPAGTFEYDPLLGNTAYFSLLSLMYKGHPLGRYSPIDPDGQVRTAIEIPYEPGVVTIPTSESDIQTKVQSALDDDKFPVLTDNSDYYVYSGKTQSGDDMFFKIEGTVITTAVVDSTDTVTQTSVDLAGFIETVECASGPNIDAVGTPSVSAVNDPVLHKTTLTFNYLKGKKGDQGNPGTNGTNGTNGTSAYWFKGTAVTGTGTGISAVVGGSKAGDMYLNSNTQDVYIATAANMWDYVCNIKGATGTWGGTVDQSYNALSSNPQSGKAVAEAVADKADNTPTFTEASTRVNLNGSNETMPTILGKVKKWFKDLKALAFKSTVGTSDIDDDAITAAKVKDNETLPVNISGNAATAGKADKLRYQNDNTIDFANVPTTGYKHRSWFNCYDGDTHQANPSNPLKSYWFGDRNGKTDNTKLVTGGITNKTFIGSSSSVTWNSSVGTGFGCCCIKFSYDLTTGKTRTVVIRLLIDCNQSNGDMCYVDLMLKVQPNDWNTFAIATGRFDTGTNFNLGRLYYRRATNVYYFAIETGGISSKVTPIILGIDNESDSDFTTLNVEFGDFNSELASSDWVQHSTKRVVYRDMSGTPVGSSSIPNYVDTDGQVQPCNFAINFGSTLVAGSNVLNIAN